MSFKSTEKFGFAKIVTVLVATILAGRKIGAALADGLDFGDFFAVTAVVPNVQLIVAEGKQALVELADLTPDESQEAALQIAAQAGLNNATGVLGLAGDALVLLAKTHREVDDDIKLIGEWKEFAEAVRVAA